MNATEALLILGLDPDVSYNTRQIEQAFRRLAKVHHQGGDDLSFRALQQAKELLLGHHDVDDIFISTASSISATVSPVLKHASCVRQISVSPHLLVAATDDGLFIKHLTTTSQSIMSRQDFNEYDYQRYLVDQSFSCSDISDTHIYAGGKGGVLVQMALHNNGRSQQPLSLHHPDNQTNDTRIVALKALTINANDFVAIVSVDPNTVEVLPISETTTRPQPVWSVAENELQKWFLSPEAVLLQESFFSKMLHVWVGGSEAHGNDGTVVMWGIELATLCIITDNLEERGDELYFWDLTDDSDTESNNGNEQELEPTLVKIVEEGPIYTMAINKSMLAAAAGNNVLLGDGLNFDSFTTTWSTNQVLYSVALNNTHVAAGGSGENVYVWNIESGALEHTLRLSSPKMCCFASHCIMSIVWYPSEPGVLLCGGYHNYISMWVLAHRLPQDQESCE